MRIKTKGGCASVCTISNGRIRIDAGNPKHAHNDFVESVSVGERSIMLLVSEGENIKYCLTQYDELQRVVNREEGIGVVEYEGGATLTRKKPFYKTVMGESMPVKPNGQPMSFPHGAICVLEFSNKAMSHEGPCIECGDQCIVLEPNTFIYVDENLNVDCLSPEEVFQKLSVDDIQLESIQMKAATRDIKPKDGTLIYNKRTGNLEFYNGTEWLSVGLK